MNYGLGPCACTLRIGNPELIGVINVMRIYKTVICDKLYRSLSIYPERT